MMGRSKEEDKIEKIIRGLLKLSENRRCINCNSLVMLVQLLLLLIEVFIYEEMSPPKFSFLTSSVPNQLQHEREAQVIRNVCKGDRDREK